MLADALKMNQSLQNLRSVAIIHNWCNAFLPGVHAIGILCLMCEIYSPTIGVVHLML